MLGVLEAVVVKASHFLLEGFRQRRGLSVIEDKGDDVTREIDLQIEELVYRMLKESYREGVFYTQRRGVNIDGEMRGLYSS